jgi:hypothetical protein
MSTFSSRMVRKATVANGRCLGVEQVVVAVVVAADTTIADAAFAKHAAFRRTTTSTIHHVRLVWNLALEVVVPRFFL